MKRAENQITPPVLGPLTDAFCDELRKAGAHRVATVLRDVADRGVDLQVAFGKMPDHHWTLYVETECYNRGLMAREERQALIGAVGCTGDGQRMEPELRLSLSEHCGCGKHPHYSRLVLAWH